MTTSYSPYRPKSIKRTTSFKPDRQFLNREIARYLKSGGKIETVEVMPDIDKAFHPYEADFFLLNN